MIENTITPKGLAQILLEAQMESKDVLRARSGRLLSRWLDDRNTASLEALLPPHRAAMRVVAERCMNVLAAMRDGGGTLLMGEMMAAMPWLKMEVADGR